MEFAVSASIATLALLLSVVSLLQTSRLRQPAVGLTLYPIEDSPGHMKLRVVGIRGNIQVSGIRLHACRPSKVIDLFERDYAYAPPCADLDNPVDYLPSFVIREGRTRDLDFTVTAETVNRIPAFCPPDTWRIRATCFLANGKEIRSNLSLCLGEHAVATPYLARRVERFLRRHQRKQDRFAISVG